MEYQAKLNERIHPFYTVFQVLKVLPKFFHNTVTRSFTVLIVLHQFLHQQMSFFTTFLELHSILYTWKWNKIFSWISVLLMDLPTPFHPHRYPFNGQNLLAWHKYLVCAPITGLKLSFLVCKTGFYRPKHKAKGDLMELSFKGLEMQK